MRLLNTKSLKIRVHNSKIPEYVILSHRWEHDERDEVIYTDILKDPISNVKSPARLKHGFRKVEGACALAARDGYEWIWIDSCCIDKSSSAELQEAINSMYAWYHRAQLCYVYLSDVPNEGPNLKALFHASEWFSRGWTLQELLAPQAVEFYAADWSAIGSRQERYGELASITGISERALFRPWTAFSQTFTAAQKFSWAAHRIVSREEDEAYCLLGLFDVNLAMMYGEGRQKAFYRLQEAIFAKDADHSIFLFRPDFNASWMPMFADTVARFCQKDECRTCSHLPLCLPADVPYFRLFPTLLPNQPADNQHLVRLVRDGVTVQLSLVPYNDVRRHMSRARQLQIAADEDGIFAVLNVACYRNSERLAICIPLRKRSDTEYLRAADMPLLLPWNILAGLAVSSRAITIHEQVSQYTQSGNFYLLESRNVDFTMTSCHVLHGGQTVIRVTDPKSPLEIPVSINKTSTIVVRVSSKANPDVQITCDIETRGPRDGEMLAIQRAHSTLDSWRSTNASVELKPSDIIERIILPLTPRKGLCLAIRRLAAAVGSAQGSGMRARYRFDVIPVMI